MQANKKMMKSTQKQQTEKTLETPKVVKDAWDDEYETVIAITDKPKESNEEESDEEESDEEESDEEESDEEESDEEESDEEESDEEESDEEESDEEESDEEESEDKKYIFKDSFEEMDQIPGNTLRGIYQKGYECPAAAQVMINTAIENSTKSFIVDAATGSGKTCAAMAIVASCINLSINRTQAIIVVPTHRLALMHYKYAIELLAGTKIDIACHRGAGGIDPDQIKRDKSRVYLTNNPKTLLGNEQMIICTPGKLLQLFDEKVSFTDSQIIAVPNHRLGGDGLHFQIDAKYVSQIVLDECDALLTPSASKHGEKTVSDTVNTIIDGVKQASPYVRFLLYSASAKNNLCVERFMIDNNAKLFCFDIKNRKEILHHYYLTLKTESEKPSTLVDILENKRNYNSVYVFCNSKQNADIIYKLLKEKNFSVGNASSTITQREQDEIMEKFRKNQYKILVATDSCARGIDIASCDLVINVDLPKEFVVYQHRSGRAGRYSRRGNCISFAVARNDEVPEVITQLSKYMGTVIRQLDAAVMKE